MGQPRQKTVAVVGTGLTGLVTAHLLHNDAQQRYAVKVLERVSLVLSLCCKQEEAKAKEIKEQSCTSNRHMLIREPERRMLTERRVNRPPGVKGWCHQIRMG